MREHSMIFSPSDVKSWLQYTVTNDTNQQSYVRVYKYPKVKDIFN